jgi:colicin import membrane protein
MKPDRHHAGSSGFNAAGGPVRSAASYFLLSAALHVVLLAALIWVPASFSTPRVPPGAISVNLVSLPGPAPAAAGGGSAGEPAKPVEAPAPPPEKPVVAAVEPAPRPVPEAPKPQVSLAPPKVREKKSLKEETKNPQKMIEKAIDRIEKNVKEPDTQSVTAAIDRIRKKLGEAEPAAPARPGAPGPGRTESGAGAGGGGGGPGSIEPADIYRAEIAYQVEKNWAFSPQLAGSNKQLVASLVFKVLPSGEITDVRFTERSNNTYLDESAYRAIVKSNPVKPHPPNIRMPHVLVGIRFTPEGMR